MAKKNNKGSKVPKLKYDKIGGDLTYDPISAPQIDTPDFEFTDVNFNVDTIQADTLADRFMTAAEYAMVDPKTIAAEFGDINRSEMEKNSDLSSKLALDALNTELQGLQNFVPAASALKRKEIALDNTFNQAERDRMLALGDPNMRADLEAQAARARAYADGRVPDAIQDRALELGIRSRAADAASLGGFGVGSSAARKASSLMSAEQRIQLSQYGDQLLTGNMANRASTLLAPTSYSDAGAQVQVTPSVSAGQAAMAIASEANAGNITAAKALDNLTQQEQFKTGIEQDTNKFNISLAADKDLNQARMNLEAASANASNSLTAQTTAAQIQSAETRAKAELDFNVANANAQRTFEASNINATNALKVAESNRNTRLEIQKTNKTFVFQDRQARQAEAAANARASIAAAASRANAQLNYQAQKEALAANIAEKEKDRAFALTQQGQALDIYKEHLEKGQSNSDAGAVGSIISRAPSVVSGIKDTIGVVKDIINTFSPSSKGEPIGQNMDGSYIYA